MRIESLLTEAEISEEFAEALEARDLPEKFFYWSPMSVRAWQALSRDLAFESCLHSWNLLVHDSESIAREFNQAISVVSLGAGSGAKDLLLVKALEQAGKRVEYLPVDASMPLLERACAAAEESEIEALGLKADISSPVHLVLISDTPEHPRLYLLCGNTLGGFDPLDELMQLASCMRAGDRLIVDAELADGSALPSRDHPVGRRFALAPLSAIGVGPDDGEVLFELRQDERHAGLEVVTRHFHVARDLRLHLPEREIPVQRGERINLNFNYTYSPEAFRWLLTERAGLHILREYPSPDGRYVTAVCARSR
jgi:uncharacterized SAM-dependent methyltransferase